MYYMPAEYLSDGSLITDSWFTVHLVYASHIITILLLCLMTYKGIMIYVVVLIDIAIVVAAYILQILDTSSDGIYEMAIRTAHKNATAVIGFILSIFVVHLINWIWWELLHSKLRFPIFHWMKYMCSQDTQFESETHFNSYVLEMFNPPEDMTHVVKRCFGASNEIDKVIEHMLDRSSEDKVEYSPITLHIKQHNIRDKYSIHVMQKFITSLRYHLGMCSFFLLVFSLVTAGINGTFDMIFFVNIGITICVAAIFFITLSRSFEINSTKYAWIIVISCTVIAAFNSLVREADHSLLSVVIVIFTITNYNVDFRAIMILIALQFIWYCCSYLFVFKDLDKYLWIYEAEGSKSVIMALVSLVLLVFLIKLVVLGQRYQLELLIKREFIAGSLLQSRSNITTDFLKLLLPSFVLDQMTNLEISEKTVDDDAGEVTIIFCDIDQFDKIVQEKEDEIVKILDSIFRRFDELCKENGCQKIETVGKTYMACGGLKYVEQSISSELKILNPSQRVLNLAKSMIIEIKNFEDLNLKIGIHRGKVMMGVIGYHKPQFSLIGDAVNTTSRHCTTGEKGHIMVSNEAFEAINSITFVKSRQFNYKKTTLTMKGKGEVDAYDVFPSKNLIKKRLIDNIERRKANMEELPKDLLIFDDIFYKSKNQIKKNFATGRIHKMLKDLIYQAKGNFAKDDDGEGLDDPSSPVSRRKDSDRRGLINGDTPKNNVHGIVNGFPAVPVQQEPEGGVIVKPESDPNAGEHQYAPPKIDTPHGIVGNTKSLMAPALGQLIPDKKRKRGKEENKKVEKQRQEGIEGLEDDTEYVMLKPTPFLKLKRNQFFQMKKYKLKIREMNKNYLRVYLGILSLYYIIAIVLHFVLKEGIIFTQEVNLGNGMVYTPDREHGKYLYSLISNIVAAVISIMMIFMPTFFYTRLGKLMYFTVYVGLSAACALRLFILHGYVRLYYSHAIVLEMVLLYICSLQCAVLDFMEAVLLYVFQLAFFLVFNIMKYRSITTDGNYLFDYTIFFVVMGIYSIFNYYQYIATEIAWYNTEGQTSEKKERIKDFIERLVPKHVTQQLNSADGSIGSEYKNVTLLYADIVGFTAYCSGRNTKEVFQMLSRLFTAFDKECNALELYKVYTIGDCYVVMSFLDAHKRYEPEEEAADVVEFGFSMIEIIAKVRKEVNFDGLHMRIGIHTGKIYGGIVGTDIIRFDMYGSDVLIANKLESSGAQDKIHISQATKDLLDLANQDKRYRFTPDHVLTFNKFTPAREIMTYFIDRNVNDGDKA